MVVRVIPQINEKGLLLASGIPKLWILLVIGKNSQNFWAAWIPPTRATQALQQENITKTGGGVSRACRGDWKCTTRNARPENDRQTCNMVRKEKKWKQRVVSDGQLKCFRRAVLMGIENSINSTTVTLQPCSGVYISSSSLVSAYTFFQVWVDWGYWYAMEGSSTAYQAITKGRGFLYCTRMKNNFPEKQWKSGECATWSVPSITAQTVLQNGQWSTHHWGKCRYVVLINVSRPYTCDWNIIKVNRSRDYAALRLLRKKVANRKFKIF